MDSTIELSVSPDSYRKRLDAFLSEAIPGLSRARARRAIVEGHVTADGRTILKPSSPAYGGQRIIVTLPDPSVTPLEPMDFPLDIIHEDEDVIVLNKPAGLVVHPAAGHEDDTLVNALLGQYADLAVGGSIRPGIVHRLDKDTSGLMVVARNDAAMNSLAKQIAAHEVEKRYLTLIHGHPMPASGVIDAPIGRDPHDRKRMAIVSTGRAARTHYSTAESLGAYTLVEATLETGRTHQIRVHFAAIGCPVAGDAAYGPPLAPEGLARQFLHARRLGFRSPSTGAWLAFEASLPPDLSGVLERLRQAR